MGMSKEEYLAVRAQLVAMQTTAISLAEQIDSILKRIDINAELCGASLQTRLPIDDTKG
jgi:hypothetical protein